MSLPKCSSGQLECKLDNPAKSLSLKVQYFQLRFIFSREFLATEVSKRSNFGQVELRCHIIDCLLLHAGPKIASNSHKLNLVTTFNPIQNSVAVRSLRRFVCERNLLKFSLRFFWFCGSIKTFLFSAVYIYLI